MSSFKLKSNQAALVIDVSSDGIVNVESISPEKTDTSGDLAAAICAVIGEKLTGDESFQEEVIDTIHESDD